MCCLPGYLYTLIKLINFLVIINKVHLFTFYIFIYFTDSIQEHLYIII